MGWSKRQIVSGAYAELALAGWDVDLSPEELQTGLNRLDLFMASWDAQGIRLGYALSLSPDDSDLDQQSGLPLFAVRAVVLTLACELAAGKGKQLAVSTTRACKSAYDSMISKLASESVIRQQLPSGMHLGAGNKRFTSKPNTDPLQASENGGDLTFSGA